MDVSLQDKVILVTGGTQGVGAEIAREAAAKGAAGLVIVGRTPSKGEAVCADLEQLGARAKFIAADLADPATPAAIVREAVAAFGTLDGLVNSAGNTDRGSFLDGDVATWDTLFAVNARAPFLLMQEFIGHCLDRKRPGSIVNIQSMNAHCGSPELAMYSASKGALQTLTRNAAHAHMSDRIRVNGINMGWSPTEAENVMQAQTLGKGDDWAADVTRQMPLGRLLEPGEVARLAVYLLSDYSGLQTGTSIDLEQRVVGAP